MSSMRLICKAKLGWYPNIKMFNAASGDTKYHYSKVYEGEKFSWPGDSEDPPPNWADPHPEDQAALDFYEKTYGWTERVIDKWVFADTPTPTEEMSKPGSLGDVSPVKKRGPGRPRKSEAAAS